MFFHQHKIYNPAVLSYSRLPSHAKAAAEGNNTFCRQENRNLHEHLSWEAESELLTLFHWPHFDSFVLVSSHFLFLVLLVTRSAQTRGAAGPGRSVCSHVDETAGKSRHANRNTDEQPDSRHLTLIRVWTFFLIHIRFLSHRMDCNLVWSWTNWNGENSIICPINIFCWCQTVAYGCSYNCRKQ